jgi:phosphoglucosamine mutase
MSNLGMETALRDMGIGFHRSKVGDRYVMELLKKTGSIVGGEGSGHIICLDRTTTGDGIVAALQVLTAMQESGQTLHELKKGMEKFPQCLVNVSMTRRIDPDNDARICSAIKEVEADLGDSGRVLLRLSGTEPLVRVMVEGRDEKQVSGMAQQLAEVVREAAEHE